MLLQTCSKRLFFDLKEEQTFSQYIGETDGRRAAEIAKLLDEDFCFRRKAYRKLQNHKDITLYFLKAYEQLFTVQTERPRRIDDAEVDEGMRKYLNERYLSNQFSDSSHVECQSATGAFDKGTVFPLNVNDSDVTIPPVR